MHYILQHHAIFIPLLLALIAFLIGMGWRWKGAQSTPQGYPPLAGWTLLPLMVAGIALMVLIYLFTAIESALFSLDGLYFNQEIVERLMARYRRPMFWTGLIFLVATHASYFLGLLTFFLRGKKWLSLLAIGGGIALYGIGILYLNQ